jgi:heat-inducible transcriptional repressor
MKFIESPQSVNELFVGDEEGFGIHIAEDNGESLQDVSVISSDINIGGEHRGKIALVGPKRMDYDKVLTALEYLVEQINNLYEEDEDGRKS